MFFWGGRPGEEIDEKKHFPCGGSKRMEMVNLAI
jgi:hypothetical protein